MPPDGVEPYNAPSGPITSAANGLAPFASGAAKTSSVTTAGGVTLDSGGVQSAQAKLAPLQASARPASLRPNFLHAHRGVADLSTIWLTRPEKYRCRVVMTSGGLNDGLERSLQRIARNLPLPGGWNQAAPVPRPRPPSCRLFWQRTGSTRHRRGKTLASFAN